MEIDIRQGASKDISVIRFADEPNCNSNRYTTKLVNHGSGYCYMEDEDDNNSVRFDDADQLRNGIAALQKALELGWVK